jgi:glyoxylase-like metal-dependent hydrolase (beta-lactamase superfamily II)
VGARPRAIVLTHVHPDHAGSASELAHMWDVTVYVHHDELPLPPSGRIIGALARIERSWMFPSRQDRCNARAPGGQAPRPGRARWRRQVAGPQNVRALGPYSPPLRPPGRDEEWGR